MRRTSAASLEEVKGAMVNASQLASGTMVFEHQPGCRVCKGMFEHYVMPDGRAVHLFERPQEVDGTPCIFGLMLCIHYVAGTCMRIYFVRNLRIDSP